MGRRKTYFVFRLAQPDLGNSNPHSVAVAVKQFFLELPEPIFPFDVYPKVKEGYPADGLEKDQLDFMREILALLPPLNLYVLNYLFEFLLQIMAHSQVNLMSATNLGVVFSSGLIRPKVIDVVSLMNNTNSRVVDLLLTHWETLGPSLMESIDLSTFLSSRSPQSQSAPQLGRPRSAR